MSTADQQGGKNDGSNTSARSFGIPHFDEEKLLLAAEKVVRRATIRRRLRYAGTFVLGLALGTVALFGVSRSFTTGVDRTLVASASFANLMGNEKEIRVSATGGKGRFGIAIGFKGDVAIVDPGIGKHTRFDGPDQAAIFLLPEAVTSIYLVVTDTPAGEVVRRFVNKRIEDGGPVDDPAKSIEKLKELLLDLGYSTLDIRKVTKP